MIDGQCENCDLFDGLGYSNTLNQDLDVHLSFVSVNEYIPLRKICQVLLIETRYRSTLSVSWDSLSFSHITISIALPNKSIQIYYE